jgi:uncharacterized protein
MVQADLEIAMKNHIAVVRFDCKTLAALSGCTAPGTYAYSGFAKPVRLEKKVQDSDVLQSELPLGGATFRTTIEQGLTIDIVFVTVGQRRASVEIVSRARLEGACEGATHTLLSADLGAYKLAVGTRAERNRAVDLFGGSASGTSSRSESSSIAAGAPSACEGAPSSAAPRDCQAPVRLVLSRIAPVDK